ncbi:uncharacterized protein Z519_09161 [Cladophialophora bantiana CBS 173.52]|uniref:Cytochrome P450 n=1 Tax=Cladophialophora bantiana (strain ATCC 10958 / CBS 173.52 / CDC B-1940 / NIH 8579) TaxID=1442370 RepID=A0A0D2I113_CLAB1|nr:uncharacterized protein Z519_09161 [Cladophialophora bantiana CBS 173.52]KIW90514.1 hypothetical protein Z519_09161 [Cladophialophora bantiana CBS 173.52]
MFYALTSTPPYVLPWVSLGLLAALSILYTTIYRLFFHPLAKYPGPLLARITGLYMVNQAIRCRDTYTRYELHQRYGKVVRTGPNELCFADAASIKDIYGQSTEPCLKAPYFYDGFTLTGTSSVFSSTDRIGHARMRRLLSHGFSERGVLCFHDEIRIRIERYLSIMSQSTPTDANTESAIELHDLTHNLFLDITSQLSFGKSFDILIGRDPEGARDIETYFNISPLFGVFPVARYLPFGPFKAAREAQPRIIRFVRSCIDDFKVRLSQGTSQAGLLRLMVEAKDEETNSSFSVNELIENAVIFIIAGSGTTAATLIYLLYEVGRRLEIQGKLEKEIRVTFPDLDAFPDFETATKLPYLNCVMQEVLRLRAPIPTVAPRVSPGKAIGGEYVPAGTIVSNLAYTTQRDASVFHNPDSFIPERWEHPTAEMKVMHRPFSTGPRNCVGMHLARVQLLLTVCALYQRFEISLDPRMTEDMMVQRDLGVMTPIAKQLWVRIRPRKVD